MCFQRPHKSFRESAMRSLFSTLILLSLSPPPSHTRKKSVGETGSENQNLTKTFGLKIFGPPPLSVRFGFSVFGLVLEIVNNSENTQRERETKNIYTLCNTTDPKREDLNSKRDGKKMEGPPSREIQPDAGTTDVGATHGNQ